MDPRARLDALAHGYQNACILLTANHLGVFRALGGGPRDAAGLAAELGVDARALELVLLALAAEALLQQGPDGFALAPGLAPLLLPDGAASLAAIYEHHFHLVARWAQLAEVVRTGRPAPRPREGRGADELRAFICGMADISRVSSEEVAAKLDFAPFRRLLDLGGGPGTAALTFARLHPQLRCDVYDLPEVVAIAREEIARAGLAARVGTVAGDYFTDELGTGYDCVYVSNIIHSLGPDEIAALFAKARRALTAGGTLMVKDFYLDDSRTRPASAARFAVNMLVGTAAGRSYTLTETRRWLTEAGFGAIRAVDIATASGVLIGRAGA
ncbi:MAG: methyltransferase [Candidatus Krumholzibacteriia bacterium]